MLQQAILQIEMQKLDIPALKWLLQATCTEVNQRMQIGIVIQCAQDPSLFQFGF